jgi:hypothetical protein
METSEAKSGIRLFPRAAEVVRGVLRLGQRSHRPGEWRAIPAREHVRHAVEHLRRLQAESDGAPKTGEDHLGHALTRLLMAAECRED